MRGGWGKDWNELWGVSLADGDGQVSFAASSSASFAGEAIPGTPAPQPEPEQGVGHGKKVRVRQGKGLRLREYELRQQWKREEEEERQRLLKPRRRPKVAVPIPEIAFTSESAGITVEQGWSPDMDDDDILTVLMLVET